MIEQGGELFDFLDNQKLVVHRALSVHTCGESCTGDCTGEGECISGGVSGEFRPCLAPNFPGFPSASGMTMSSPASVIEESCLCLIDCVEPLPLS